LGDIAFGNIGNIGQSQCYNFCEKREEITMIHILPLKSTLLIIYSIIV